MTDNTELVNEWTDAKMHPITGIREPKISGNCPYNIEKKRNLFVDYNYELPLNLIKYV